MEQTQLHSTFIVPAEHPHGAQHTDATHGILDYIAHMEMEHDKGSPTISRKMAHTLGGHLVLYFQIDFSTSLEFAINR